MNTKVSNLMWGIGLTQEEEREILAGSGPSYRLAIFSQDQLPDPGPMDMDTPFLIWIPLRVWEELLEDTRQDILAMGCAQKIIVLDEDITVPNLENLLELGVMGVLTRPLKSDSITKAVEKAAEMHHLFTDIYCMAREVSLERELLGRKNAQLSFINRFITRATESLDPLAILTNARQDLDMLLPVNMIHAAFWNEDGKHLETELFLTSQDDPKAEQDWTEFMLESAVKLAGRQVDGYRVSYLNSTDPIVDSLSPAPGQVMVLPLTGGGCTFGCLALHSLKPYNLGRDQVEILQTAIKHLSLALKNGLLYREVKTRADFDGLTRVYNRNYFDVRLKEEIRRHRRYKQKMSLLMADLDHFKKINDQYGHQVGDLVLREMGGILHHISRITDFAARYGGEEFVVILPQTDEAQALYLAERLRMAVEALRAPGHPVRVTASIGIATMDPEHGLSGGALLRRADQALYQAKGLGRNRVCSFDPIPEKASATA